MNIVVVLLAAGKSSRTTDMKQLYRVDGEYLINRQIKIVQSYGYKVVVILGHKYEKIRAILNKDVKVIINDNYNDGMFSSVKSAFINIKADKLIFCHIDRPMVSKEIFQKLIESETQITTTFFKNKKAPPIMINYSMKKELLNSTHKRLDYWIKSTKKASHIEVEDEQVLFNANTDEKLEQYFG